MNRHKHQKKKKPNQNKTNRKQTHIPRFELTANTRLPRLGEGKNIQISAGVDVEGDAGSEGEVKWHSSRGRDDEGRLGGQPRFLHVDGLGRSDWGGG